MKNAIIAIFLIIQIFPGILIAQDNCLGSFTEYYLNSNNIRASFFPRGNKFTDGADGRFLVPYSAGSRLSTIFASSVWIGGFDDAGNPKMAIETFPNPNRADYHIGPLDQIGIPIDSNCEHFDQAWSVFIEDIQQHQDDFFSDGIIDDTIKSIFGWPARGNKYFSKYYGFDLPEDAAGLADFYDLNSNHSYDPDQGDHPIVRFKGKTFVPDQILWMIFNDVGEPVIPETRPFGFEIQLTAFAFHCQDNEILNNTIFNSYKIINRAATTSVDSLFFGFWTDYDLGCSEDDLIGSDSTRSMEFVYNADPVDGDSGTECSTGSHTYPTIPPVQSMTYLSHPMHSFITYNSNYGTYRGLYNMLKGRWSDGTPIRPEGNGHNISSVLSPTKFLFNGDPRDTSSWSAINEVVGEWDPKVVSSVSLGRVNPGTVVRIETAYMFHHDPNGNHLDQITKMYNDVDSLLSLTFDDHQKYCTPFPLCSGDNCVWPGDFNNNGTADHYDLLTWGLMNNQMGDPRNGLISWRGHHAEEWSNETIDGINSKHGDGDGNGIVTEADLNINWMNFLATNQFYKQQDEYPDGPDLQISSLPMNENGSISRIFIKTAQDIENVFGLAYEFDFDTSVFELASGINLILCPDSTLCLGPQGYGMNETFQMGGLRYSFVGKNHSERTLSNGTILERFTQGLRLKPGIDFSQITDSTCLRLRNLIAIDAEGNNLNIGAQKLIVNKHTITGAHDLYEEEIFIFPNPAKDELYVGVPFAVEAEIANLQGQVIRKVILSSSTPLDVSNTLPGIYFLRIQELNQVLKVVIQ